MEASRGKISQRQILEAVAKTARSGTHKPFVFIGFEAPGDARGCKHLAFSYVLGLPAKSGDAKTFCFHRFCFSQRGLGKQTPCVFIGFGPPGGDWASKNQVFSLVLGLPAVTGGAKTFCFHRFCFPARPGKAKTLSFHRFWASRR